ncbi:MAG: hypothetical protein ACRCZF_25065, partial [Gemmataceae bacterium]
MIKKILLVAVVGAAVVWGLKSTKLGGIVRQEVESAKTWAEDQVPVEKEISRIRKEIKALDRDITKVGSELAKEIVDVRMLKESTDELREVVEKDTALVKARGEQISASVEKVKYGNVTMTPSDAKDRLKNDVSQLMSKRSNLDTNEKALVIRERVKENLEKQLDAMKRQKVELAVQVDALEAEFKSLQLQQIESKYQSDSTRMASIKESLRSLKRKVEIKREEMKLAPMVQEDNSGFSGLGSSTNSQSVEDILAPLDGKKP